MIGALERLLRALRRWLSRSEWATRLLGLPRAAIPPGARGLVIIQIDGLGRSQLEVALDKGRMPFLQSLLDQEGYRLHVHYSGLPASTPAVQGELFYGVKSAVPAFSFLSRATGQVTRMYDPDGAAAVERRLQREGGEPLLKDGASYLNIFTGGAAEPHFCPAALGWGQVLRAANPFALLFLLVTNLYSLLRTAVLVVVEAVLALIDGVAGLFGGHDLFKELKFVPTRVAITILLRELVTIGAKLDVARGLPVIHLNYLGYDEQAHRRGPTSAFAHWSLKGIDDAVARVWRAAQRARRRHYEVWIYSDHGQEDSLAYPERYGRSVQEAVAAVFAAQGMPTEAPAPAPETELHGVQLQRARLLGGKKVQRLFPLDRSAEGPAPAPLARLTVTALGPIGMIYSPTPLDAGQRERVARALVQDAQIPLVMAATRAGEVTAWCREGEFSLPAQAEALLGADHPFLDCASRDLLKLCHHPDAGDLVIGGWCRGEVAHTFAVERGAHAGLSPEECRGFALLPGDTALPQRTYGYLRPLDLRQAALHVLGRHTMIRAPFHLRNAVRPKTLRVMTYNVHSCIGMDGRLTPERIARVIAQYEPDVIALQELDVGRLRTGGIDQAHLIAKELQMEYHFHPAMQVEEERYGDAVLSHLPMRLVRAAALPGTHQWPRLEPRGAIWVAIDVGGVELQVFNTHLGLRPRERLVQAQALISAEWLGHPDCRGPIVLCGDLNALPGSPVCRLFGRSLRDAQTELASHRPLKTLFGRFPLARIDHVFIGPPLQITAVQVPSSALARVASDHLPLIVDLRLPHLEPAAGTVNPRA